MNRECEKWLEPGDILRRESDELLRQISANRLCPHCGQRGCRDAHQDRKEE